MYYKPKVRHRQLLNGLAGLYPAPEIQFLAKFVSS